MNKYLSLRPQYHKAIRIDVNNYKFQSGMFVRACSLFTDKRLVYYKHSLFRFITSLVNRKKELLNKPPQPCLVKNKTN